MGYGLDGWGKGLFSCPQCPDLLWGPPSPLSNEYLELSPGIKQAVCEADHPPPYSAKIRTGGALPPLPHIHVFMAWCLIKLEQGQLHLYFTQLTISALMLCNLWSDTADSLKWCLMMLSYKLILKHLLVSISFIKPFIYFNCILGIRGLL
jgi:hypothetical protein